MPEIDLFSQTIDIISVNKLLINLVVGLVLSLLLRWHFLAFGTSLSNRYEFGNNFIYIALTVTLIISIVKSSLALSLGLVGALSIIRFRTPIKEPEELSYLFIAIAIGIGLGANQVIETISAILVILVLTALFRLFATHKKSQNLFLSVSLKNAEGDKIAQQISEHISQKIAICEIKRLDINQNNLSAIYFVGTKKPEDVFNLLEGLKALYPQIEISFIDQHKIPGV